MKVIGDWKVTLNDESYNWAPDQWLGSVWNQIETDLGMTYSEFVNACAKKSFLACQWLLWYLRRTNGREEDRLATDFPLLQLEIEALPDPEEPAAVTPPSETSTESDSLTGSESDSTNGNHSA